MRAVAGVLTAVSVLMLAGCASSAEGGSATAPQSLQKPKVLGVNRGLPAGLRVDGPPGKAVAAILGPGRVALVTWGSSSCPYTPVRMKTSGTNGLRVVLDVPRGKHVMCTADLGPTTVRLGLDPAMTSDGTVALVLEFRHERGGQRVVARAMGDQG